MKRSRLIGTTGVAVATLVVSSLYLAHPTNASDHQDTFNLATSLGHNTTADITDVFVFPSPTNPANVVLAMDTAPLTGGLSTGNVFFDPTIMWQFKIAHTTSGEDQTIQFTASAPSNGTQTINVYGPNPVSNTEGTTNTLTAQTAAIPYNPSAAQSAVTIEGQPAFVFAGPRADPFNFDLFALFTFLGDRNYGTHTSQSDPGQGNNFYNGDSASNVASLTPAYDKSANPKTPSFNGFASGTMSNTSTGAGTGYACSTNPASNALQTFNVESFVIEVPKTLLELNGVSTIHVWATTSSSTTSS